MRRVVALGQDELLMSSDIARLIGEIDRLRELTQAAVGSSPSLRWAEAGCSAAAAAVASTKLIR